MNLATIRPVLLALLILFAHVGAAVHALTHLQTQPDGHAPAAACAWCVAYASLDGPAPPRAAPSPLVMAPRLLPQPVRTTQFQGAPQTPAYRSQAPPFLS
jgi:hypothetical protein